RPAGQNGQLHEHRSESQKTLDFGFASFSQAKSTSPQWDCCSGIAELDAAAAATLVNLHVRLQI
ncbi:hypothetical protein, partial [Novipirellula maiorica]|uniref:hypothetical protein n=1 Tax=Novipirellula maiorica TaxID=1265734 RepID=UPI0005939E65